MTKTRTNMRNDELNEKECRDFNLSRNGRRQM
ncbi:hypothetical protein A2U01_0111159, partial [Trifolium medium]|nr:hypothetical protein [Trifolium medium]